MEQIQNYGNDGAQTIVIQKHFLRANNFRNATILHTHEFPVR